MPDMLWRERVMLARERTRFNRDDYVAINDCRRCVLAEAGRALGMTYGQAAGVLDRGAELEGDFYRAMFEGDFDATEYLLDVLEDRVLDVKRRRRG